MCTKILTVIFTLSLVIMSWTVHAQVKLITDEEAKMPNLQIASTRAITRGPGIKLISSNEVMAKSFEFKINFEPRGGTHIDASSIKFEYLKQPVVDLTARFKTGLNGNLLELQKASVPLGSHPIKVSVRDSDGREGYTVINLDAK